MQNDLKSVINPSERIIWEGKPDKKCFILESIFNPLLPFALIWGGIDLFVIGASFGEAAGFIIPFMLLHLMPVWIYLGGVIFAFRKYRNTYYIVTDAGVYISGGALTYSYNMKPWAQLSNMQMHRGIFDQYLGVGDVLFNIGYGFDSDGDRVRTVGFSIINIADYQEVFKLCSQLQRDVHADTMYPNDLRPDQNNGYNSKYTKF